MKYKINRLDGRHSYKDKFDFYIGFASSMSNGAGPLYFNQALQWFQRTYGWSAEIRQWHDMKRWYTTIHPMIKSPSQDEPAEINRLWSWANSYDDLRIYVATEKELSLFLLTYPQDTSRR